MLAAHGCLIAVDDEILASEFEGVHADGPGDAVHLGLDGEDGLRLAGAAHVAAGHVVGVDHGRGDMGVVHAVRTGST